MRLDIVITGVGGQGNVLASRILARAAMDYGLSVRTSEAIGMAQREGVVMSQVRMGSGSFGALIPNGQADILLGFELAETVRGLPKLKQEGVVVVNTESILPVSVSLGLSQYDPDQLMSYLQEQAGGLKQINATALARQAGTPKATNIVMLGALAGLNVLPFAATHLKQVAMELIPSRLREINLKAFELGQQAVGGAEPCRCF
ncbi:indolepyruvate oxidoreductase subunit beta [Desulforamulus ruminis]|uniref:indolepyruvate oxidoreductase subunit beta n=1 Tax=Desulforamulus ruminis TaxID=1564 RepID=UPI002FD92060